MILGRGVWDGLRGERELGDTFVHMTTPFLNLNLNTREIFNPKPKVKPFESFVNFFYLVDKVVTMTVFTCLN